MRYAVLIMVCAAASGCAGFVSVYHHEQPDDPIEFFRIRDTRQATTWLFPGDAELLPDLSVGQTLGYDYQPPPQVRIAVVQLGQEVYSTWSGHFLLVNDPFQQRLPDRLNESLRIQDASYLPEMLVPEQKSAPRLRDAAALHQADLLLVYRSSCSSSYRLRFLFFRTFGANQSEGTCDVEAVLLDVRTGFVPMTTTASMSYSVERTSADQNLLVATLANQYFARREALAEAGAQVVRFLNDEN